MKSLFAVLALASSLGVNAQEATSADKGASPVGASGTENDTPPVLPNVSAKDSECEAMRARAAELDSQGQLNFSQATEYFQLRMDLTKCKATQAPPSNSFQPNPLHELA